MNNILWTSSPSSGLCDRLIDISLMSTYAKIKNSNLFFNWETVHNGNVYSWNDGQDNKSWDNIRYEDYKYENLINYFILPKNLYVNQHSNENEKFSVYLGGTFSPLTFYNSFIDKNLNFDYFINEFFGVMSEFTPTKILEELTDNIEFPDVSIHLRRKDKIRIDNDDHSTNYKELDNLNNMTIRLVESIIVENPKIKIYFCSDDLNEKNKYNEIFKKNTIEFKHENYNVSDTYVDIMILSNSKLIIMSQKHSNFSIFSSLMNKTKLIYFYDDCPIVNNGYSELGFFYNVKTFF